MPYINEEQRLRASSCPVNAGELNFAVTVLIINYFQRSGQNYQAINDIVGALDSAKAEFQRRVVAPYEDKKIEENGDVY